MARSKRCLGVDISNTHIHIADIETTQRGIRIRKLARAPLPEFELGDFEDSKKRQAAYVSTFKQLAKQEKLGGPAVFSMSGNYFFVRKLSLPFASPERLEKIIQFESRQQIPLPPDKTIRQYQVFPKPEEKEAEVVLAAAKRDNVHDFMKIVEWSGFKARSLSVSSLALFNFYSFLAGEVEVDRAEDKKGRKAGGKRKPAFGGLSLLKKGKKKGAKAEEAEVEDEPDVNPAIGADTDTDPFLAEAMADEGYEEVTAYLSLGTRTLDLCIARISKASKVLGFPRSVPLLGPNKEILKAFKKRFNLQSEKEAQALLDSSEIAAMTFDFDIEAHPNLNVEASEVASEVFDAMVGEVRRSLDFYISQPDGMAVDNVILCGPLSRIRNIGPFFEEKLGLPTQTLSIESEGSKDRIEGASSEQLAPFVIAVGLALEGVNKGVITYVNFLPEDIKTLQEFKTKYAMLGAVALFLAGNIYLGAQLGQQSVQVYQSEAQSLSDEIQIMTPLATRTRRAIDERKAVAQKFETIYKALPDERGKPLEILAKVQELKPPNVYVKTFYLLPWGELHVIGETESSDSAVQFVDNMKNNMTEYYDVEKQPDAPHLVRTQEISSRAFNRRVVEFEIGMTVKGMRSPLQTPTPTPTPVGGRPGTGPGMPGEFYFMERF